MNVAPACRPVLVQVPRGVYWNTPPLPVPAQPEMLPSPAPMSDEITAMCRLGRPPGELRSADTKRAKLWRNVACAAAIDGESSTRNRMSTLRGLGAMVYAREMAALPSALPAPPLPALPPPPPPPLMSPPPPMPAARGVGPHRVRAAATADDEQDRQTLI